MNASSPRFARLFLTLTAWAGLVVPGDGCSQDQSPGKALPEKPQTAPARLRELDFTPFTAALAALNKERLTKIGTLVADATIPSVQKALTGGEVTSEELTLYFLNRIQRYDGDLRSYTELNPLSLEEARASDKERAEGKLRGPLHGIPINLKDNIGTKAPMHTTAGAEILLNHSPEHDAALVTQLRESGAVILGKASLSELAGSLTTNPPGYNAVSGIGVNPYRKGLPVSGSSSGSAISASAFLTMASVGTETSGSLISPSASNGAVGMKPSHELISGEGIVPLIRFQDAAGPVARTVTDAAIILAAIDNRQVDYASGLDARALDGIPAGVLRAELAAADPAHSGEWLTLIDQGLAKAKAVSRDVTLRRDVELMPVIALGLSQDTLGYMAGAGVPVKSLEELQAYNAAKPGSRIPRGQNIVDLAVQIVAAVVKDASVSESGAGKVYEALALRERAKTAASLAKTFADNKVEVLVSLSHTHSEMYATAGYPAISVPLGLDSGGTPNGVTFIARPGEDAKLLAWAYAFEQATHYRRPPAGTAP